MTDNKLDISLYYSMLRVRMVEEKIVQMYPEYEMRCPVHFCIGQEAIASGVSANLTKEDYVMSNHRSHGHYLAKGGGLKEMIAEIYGKKTGCSGGKGGSMHLIDLSAGFLGAAPVVGSTIPIAVGAAWGAAQRGEKKIAVSYFGDAATEEGVFIESLDFAVLKKLPIVFVCENNSYSVNSPLSVRQAEGVDIFKRVEGHGIESRHGDGNDVKEVYKLTADAVRKARDGGGPTFLEFKTYRWLEHCGPLPDHPVCRPVEEVERWKELCPLKRFRETLLKKGILARKDMDKFEAEIASEIEDAVTFAKESPFPDESSLLTDVYAGVE